MDVAYNPSVALDESDTSLSTQTIIGEFYEISEQVSFISDVRFTRNFDDDTQPPSPAKALTDVVPDDVDTVSLNIGLHFAF